MRVLLAMVTLAIAGLCQEDRIHGHEVKNDTPRFSCPMLEIDLNVSNLDVIHGIDSWQECGE